MNLFCRTLVLTILALTVAGCGAMRSLTTKHYDFSYRVANPPVIQSPVGTPEGQPYAVASYADITGDLVSKFDKYHGGIDWAGLQYQATLTEGSDVSIRMYASLTAPTGSSSNTTVPDDATLLEELSLISTQGTVSVTESSSNQNEKLRAYINKVLNETSGNLRVYIYFEASSSTGGRLVISNVVLQGRAHGSLF